MSHIRMVTLPGFLHELSPLNELKSQSLVCFITFISFEIF